MTMNHINSSLDYANTCPPTTPSSSSSSVNEQSRDGGKNNIPMKTENDLHRLCLVKSVAFHGSLGVMFHRAGDLMNAMSHYKQSVHRHLKYSQWGGSCREASQTVKQNIFQGVPYPKLSDQYDDDNVDCEGVNANSRSFTNPETVESSKPESSNLVMPRTSEITYEVEIPPEPRRQIISSRSYQADTHTTNITTGTEPGAAFIFDAASVDQQDSPKQCCATVMFNMASIYYLKDMDSESMRLLCHLEEVRHECSPDVFARISINLGYFYTKTCRYGDAVDFLLSSLLEYLAKIGDVTRGSILQSQFFFGMAKAQYMLGQFDKSADSYQSAMVLWIQSNIDSDCHTALAA